MDITEREFQQAERRTNTTSQKVHGKFYRKDAGLDLPVYLDPEVRGYLTERAKAKGIEIN